MHLTIDKLIYGGDGLARLPADEHGRGKAVFVPFVLAGEEIDASLVGERQGFARARVDTLVAAAKSRVPAPCPYFQRCGGCHYQHAVYEHQLEIKAAILRENLRRIAKMELEADLKVHCSAPWNYRNRTRLKVRSAPQFAIGYYGFGSHELLPIRECPISSPLINRAIAALWQTGKAPEGLVEIEIFANADDSQLLVELHCSQQMQTDGVQSWATEFRQKVTEIAGVAIFRSPRTPSQGQPQRVALVGTDHLTYAVGPDTYRVSAGGFFQVNRGLIGQLVDLVVQGHSGNYALDLYAGAGLFSRRLAGNFAQVTAVESSPISFGDLLYNVPENVEGVYSTTEAYLKKAKRRPDLVVADPPRSGMGEQVVHKLLQLRPAKIIYVSCDPATLSRDLRLLLLDGYEVEEAHLLDLFPQTYHLESVFRLAA